MQCAAELRIVPFMHAGMDFFALFDAPGEVVQGVDSSFFKVAAFFRGITTVWVAHIILLII